MSLSKEKMITVYPFFLQYEVRPTSSNAAYGTLAGAIATVIVFAETEEQARARSSRYVGRNNWEIIEVKRRMLIVRHHIDTMDGVLKSVYQQAEQAGIAGTFDGWKVPGGSEKK